MRYICVLYTQSNLYAYACVRASASAYVCMFVYTPYACMRLCTAVATHKSHKSKFAIKDRKFAPKPIKSFTNHWQPIELALANAIERPPSIDKCKMDGKFCTIFHAVPPKSSYHAAAAAPSPPPSSAAAAIITQRFN